MTVESATIVNELVAANPSGSNTVKEGDDHIRLMKQVLLNSSGASGDLLMGFNTRDAAVADTNLLQGKIVQTLGKTTVGDGAGGLYRVVAPGTGTPDDLNYVDLTGSSGQLELIALNDVSQITYERQVMAGGETVITLANAYTPGSNSLQVYRNGIHQVTPTDFTEDSTTQITLGTNTAAGEVLDFYVIDVTLISISASGVSFTPSGNLEATDVQAALEELDSEKSDNSHTHPYLLIAQNLADLDDAATAFDNIKQAASMTSTGVVEIATQAEVDAGLDATRVLTPVTLANYSGLGDDAIQLIASAFVSGSVALNNFGAEVQTHTVEATVAGGAVKIEFSARLTDTSPSHEVFARLKRDGVVIAQFASVSTGSPGGAWGTDVVISGEFVELPGAGTYDYTIEMSGVAGMTNVSAEQRNIAVGEF